MNEPVLLPGAFPVLDPVVALGPGAAGPRPCSGAHSGAPSVAGPGPNASFHKAFLMRVHTRSSAGEDGARGSGSGQGAAVAGAIEGSPSSVIMAHMPPPPLEIAYMSDGCGGCGADGIEDFEPAENPGRLVALPDVPKPLALSPPRSRRASACAPSNDAMPWGLPGGAPGAGGVGLQGRLHSPLMDPVASTRPQSPLDRGAMLGSSIGHSLRTRLVAGSVSHPGVPPAAVRALGSRARGASMAGGGAAASVAMTAVAAEEALDSDRGSDEMEQGSRRGSLLGAAAAAEGLSPFAGRRGTVLAWGSAARESAGSGLRPSSPAPASSVAQSGPSTGPFRRLEDIPAAPSPSSSRSLAAGSALSPSPGTPATGSPRPSFALQPTPSGRFSIGFSRRPEDLPAAPHPSHSRSLAGGSAASTPGTPGSAMSGVSSPRPTALGTQQSGCSSCSGGASRRQIGDQPPAACVSRRDSTVGLSRRPEDLPAAPNPRNARSLAGPGPGSAGGGAGGASGPTSPVSPAGAAPPHSPGPSGAWPQASGGSQIAPPSPQYRLRRLASSLMGALRPDSAGRQRPPDSGQPTGAGGGGGGGESGNGTGVGGSSGACPSPPSPQVVSVRPAPPSPRVSVGTGAGASTGAGAAEGGYNRSIGYSRRMQDLPAAPGPSNSRSLAAAASSGSSLGSGGGSIRLGGITPGSAPESSTRRVGWRASMDGPLTPPSGGPAGGSVGISRRPDEIPPAPSPSQARSLRPTPGPVFHSFNARASYAGAPTQMVPSALGGSGAAGDVRSYAPAPPASPAPPMQQQSQRGRGLEGSQVMVRQCTEVVEDLEVD